MTSKACPLTPKRNADNCLWASRSNSVHGPLAGSQKFCGEFTKTLVADLNVVPAYAKSACVGNVIERASSACACLPTPSG
ncbi:hypothetical protein BDZ45DRAFT_668588 [Acephala macrosclerotiorum]|nr:hypothetical protein BDZ45DRAFT_668588 [Acephala macrosclerotiorum]